jgi:hypothetical protein
MAGQSRCRGGRRGGTAREPRGALLAAAIRARCIGRRTGVLRRRVARIRASSVATLPAIPAAAAASAPAAPSGWTRRLQLGGGTDRQGNGARNEQQPDHSRLSHGRILPPLDGLP